MLVIGVQSDLASVAHASLDLVVFVNSGPDAEI